MGLSSYKPIIYADVNVDKLLPSADTDSHLVNNLTILISRVLVDNMAAFKLYFEDVVLKHISHKFSTEMNKKSEVVMAITETMIYNNTCIYRYRLGFICTQSRNMKNCSKF